MEGVNLGGEVRRIVSRLEAANPDLSLTARYKRAWSQCADEAALAHTDAFYLVPGTEGREVIVYVDSQIWAAELNLQTELLRLRMNMSLSEDDERRRPQRDDVLFDYEQKEHIKSMRFVPSKEKYTRHKETGVEAISGDDAEMPAPVALDEGEMVLLRAEVMQIQDEELRESVFEAARAHLELMKGKEEEE